MTDRSRSESDLRDHGGSTTEESRRIDTRALRARVAAVTGRAATLLVSSLPVRCAGRGIDGGSALDRAAAMTRLDALDALLTRIEVHDGVLGWPDSCRRALREWRRLSLQDSRNWTQATVIEYEQLR